MRQSADPPGAHRRISSSDAAHRLFAALATSPREVSAFAYVDADWRLLGMRHVPGGAAAAALPIRLVALDALAFGAHSVLMAHNHPQGEPVPSEGDLLGTRRLAEVLHALGAPLFDHLILAANGWCSLRELGLL